MSPVQEQYLSLLLCKVSWVFWSAFSIHHLLLWMVACDAVSLKGLNYSFCLTVTFNKAWDSH